MKVLVGLLSVFLAGQVLAAPDEEILGKAEGYPLCPAARSFVDAKCVIGVVSRTDEVYEARKVPNAPPVRPLKRADKEPPISWSHGIYGGTLDDYLARHRTTGLLILQGDTILVERYQYERKPEHRMNSYSMAKTIVAMLVGIAKAEGKIKSLDDKVEAYVPELKGTAYGETPLRHVLTMSSGIRFREGYDSGDDFTVLARGTILRQGPGGVASVAPFKDRARPPGERYVYNSADTQVLGLVLRAAVGKSLSEYMSEKIWQPLGAESHASWLVDAGGFETAYAFFQATLRDWGRLGMLLANDGVLDGKEIIPPAWVREATTVHGEHLKVGRAETYYGYGYQVRILPGERRQFALFGLRGQRLFVDPQAKLVMVHTAARNVQDQDANAATTSLWQGVYNSIAKL